MSTLLLLHLYICFPVRPQSLQSCQNFSEFSTCRLSRPCDKTFKGYLIVHIFLKPSVSCLCKMNIKKAWFDGFWIKYQLGKSTIFLESHKLSIQTYTTIVRFMWKIDVGLHEAMHSCPPPLFRSTLPTNQNEKHANRLNVLYHAKNCSTLVQNCSTSMRLVAIRHKTCWVIHDNSLLWIFIFI